MTPHRILQFNAVSTAASALAMLVTRQSLHSLFGLESPALLDILAVGLLAYAVALVVVTKRRIIDRQALMTFAIGDAIWVVGSAIVLLLFWAQLAPVARVLVIGAALVVEVFAVLQFRAAGGLTGRTAEMA